MADNRWADIYRTLKEAGHDVYSPGQHIGECLAPYVVVKISTGTQYQDFSTLQYSYDLMIYVPKDDYSVLESYVEQVKSDMKKLQPMIMPLNTQTPSYYDDAIKGHMISVQYRNYRKL